MCVCVGVNLFRCNPGLCLAPTQTVPEGDQIFCLSGRAADEDAEDAGAASHRLQSGHRSACSKHRRKKHT